MTASSYGAALARVLRHEGGYSNHPADPGGPTNKGVIQRVYDAHRARRGLSPRSVKLIEEAELQAIYRTQYWDAVRGDDLPAGLDYAVFDAAVNSGPVQAAKWLQRALGLAADGQIGAVTLSAAQAALDRGAVVEALCDQRLAMLRGLRTWPVFGKGWAARVADVRRDAGALARGVPLLPADSEGGATAGARAAPSDQALATIARTPEAVAGGIAVAGALVNAASAPGPLQWALAAAILAALAIGGWRFVVRQRAAA
ncbi:glycoside hydrolase family 108 protein [Aquabacter spiritensis]|uniref:Lysozyme family protein n=1 Tax=Aquabacter spiritensis TaxID=933073 RepID=A0A4R3M5S4_9HYPH|nr:glycoside hydrolase family 108 protein [Aquabacter spiritensis]TCT07609.1 lysozyme family protein [Aquabacter spiritensis]